MPDSERSSVERFTIRWDAAMGCYRVSVPDLQGPVEVVTAEAHEAEVERLREALHQIKEVMGTSTLQWKIADEALRLNASFIRERDA